MYQSIPLMVETSSEIVHGESNLDENHLMQHPMG